MRNASDWMVTVPFFFFPLLTRALYFLLSHNDGVRWPGWEVGVYSGRGGRGSAQSNHLKVHSSPGATRFSFLEVKLAKKGREGAVLATIPFPKPVTE